MFCHPDELENVIVYEPSRIGFSMTGVKTNEPVKQPLEPCSQIHIIIPSGKIVFHQHLSRHVFDTIRLLSRNMEFISMCHDTWADHRTDELSPFSFPIEIFRPQWRHDHSDISTFQTRDIWYETYEHAWFNTLLERHFVAFFQRLLNCLCLFSCAMSAEDPLSGVDLETPELLVERNCLVFANTWCLEAARNEFLLW